MLSTHGACSSSKQLTANKQFHRWLRSLDQPMRILVTGIQKSLRISVALSNRTSRTKGIQRITGLLRQGTITHIFGECLTMCQDVMASNQSMDTEIHIYPDARTGHQGHMPPFLCFHLQVAKMSAACCNTWIPRGSKSHSLLLLV